MGSVEKILLLLLAAGILWVAVPYLLPVLLPFGAGLLIALAAEPFVTLSQNKFRMKRNLATGIGVSLTLILLCGILTLLCALLWKELMILAGKLPDMGSAVQQGLSSLEGTLTTLSVRAPEAVRPLLTNAVNRFFHDGSALTEQITQKVPAALSAVVSWVPGGAIGIGTALLSAFMLSARLPQIKQYLKKRLPETPLGRYLPGLKRCRAALWGWLKAQAKLSFVTFVLVGIGFFLLKIPYALGIAALVAVVDAVPILGTGTVLVPWALVCLLQQQQLRAIGLLAIYAVALVTRTALEPRLVGKHLGLDPLVTLLCLYLGFRLWGIPGMILAPILATAAAAFFRQSPG